MAMAHGGGWFPWYPGEDLMCGDLIHPSVAPINYLCGGWANRCQQCGSGSAARVGASLAPGTVLGGNVFSGPLGSGRNRLLAPFPVVVCAGHRY